MNPNFALAADAMSGWRDDVLSGTPPLRYPVGVGPLANLQIGPGLVTLIGGGSGGREKVRSRCSVRFSDALAP